MEEINVIQDTIENVEAVAEEVKGIDLKAVGLAGLVVVGTAVVTYKGIKFLVSKHKDKQAKKAKQKAESTFAELGDAIEADLEVEELIETEIVKQC